MTLPFSEPFIDPDTLSVSVMRAAGHYRTPRPPVVTSAAGVLSIVSVDDGACLMADMTADRFFTAESYGSLLSQQLVGVVKASLDVLDGDASDRLLDQVAAQGLVLPRSRRWREAVQTALIGDWSDALWDTGHLPVTALGSLKAQARAVHRQLAPVWRRRTAHGRVLSLDAALGAGLSLHDLVAAETDLLARAVGGVFADERLNRVLRALTPDEQQVVYAYAERAGTTWTEAAAHTGAADPETFGERVRRKTKRLAAEQHRRTAQCRPGSPAA